MFPGRGTVATGEARKALLVRLYEHIKTYTELSEADKQSDGAYLAMHEDAVENYNDIHFDFVDFYDVMADYFDWLKGTA